MKSNLAVLAIFLVLISVLTGFSVMPCFSAAEGTQLNTVPDIQEPASDANKELNIDDLMDKIFLAYGGKEAWVHSEESELLVGKKRVWFAYDGSSVGDMQFHQLKKGGKQRVDLEPLPEQAAAGSAQVSCSTVVDSTDINGMSAWRSINGVIKNLPELAVKDLSLDALRQPAVLTCFRQRGYVFSLLGRTTYKQTPVFAIEVTKEGESTNTVFVDQNNYLVVAITGTKQDPSTPGSAANNVPVVFVNEFSEYRPSAGIMVPYKQSQYINGKLANELLVESVSFEPIINNNEDENIFRRSGESTFVRLTKPEVVPVEYIQDELVLKVRLNDGEPLDFLLDTGASDTIIDRRVAAEHFLDKQGNVSVSAASAAVSTQATVIRKIEFGNCVIKNASALILDMTPQSRQLGRAVAGIIGTNILKNFVVSINYDKPQIVLNDADSYQIAQGTPAIAFEQQDVPVVKAILNGNDEEQFLVDTGAAFNHLPANMAKRYIKGQSHLVEGTGLDGRPVKLGMVVIDTIGIGTQQVKQISFTYPAQNELAANRGGFFQTNNVGILGNTFWQNFTVVLDYKHKRLLLQTNTVMRAKQDIQSCIASGDIQLVIHRNYRQALSDYQKGLLMAQTAGDVKNEALFVGRMGNLYRAMAHDLKRTEHARVAYDYFKKAQRLARKVQARAIEGRILGDWSVLYSDKEQDSEAQSTIDAALLLAPQDPQVNVDYAVLLYRRHLYTDMQKYIDKALSLDPANWLALWYQVKLSEMYMDVPKLKSTLKDILRFYPWSKLAQEKLAAHS